MFYVVTVELLTSNFRFTDEGTVLYNVSLVKFVSSVRDKVTFDPDIIL